jgi:hypothetical protein
MKPGTIFTVSTLIGAALFASAPCYAQTADKPPSAVASPQSAEKSWLPKTSSANERTFTATQTPRSGGAQIELPEAPRVDNGLRK